MSTIKNPTRFAELEYCLQGYFDGKLALVMKQVRDDLTHKQLEERGRYQSSLAGVLASANPYADNTERSEERRVGKECRSRWSPYH